MSTKILKCLSQLSVKKRLIRCILLFCSALSVLSAPLQGQQDPILRTVEKVKKNVVTLTTAFPDGHEENGFGFVTGEKDGKLYLVTAGHVLHQDQGAKAVSIQAQVFNSLSLFPAKEVRWFESDDLSLLVLDAIPGYRWEKNCLGKTPQVYDKVRFVGKEKRLVSPGEGEIVSLEHSNRIEFTIATMAPGTSGAPLVGKNGIVGMVIEDANSSSTALALSRIRALIGSQDFPYFSASDFQEGVGSDNEPDPSVAEEDADLRQYSMIKVRGGTYEMGSLDGEDDEEPIHRVTVSDFYIGKYEVTVQEFKAFVEATGYTTDAEKDGGSYFCTGKEWQKKARTNWRYDAEGNVRTASQNNHPVLHVSWNDAVEYCKWLSKQTGKTYRLPTEAEWEYAAGNGSKHTRYSWGNSNPSGKQGGNVADETGASKFYWAKSSENIFVGYTDGYATTSPIGSFNANELGLHDMSGNVWEWCQDWYGTYSPSAQPKGPDTGSHRVFRGGSWLFFPRFCRVANRSYDAPGYRDNLLGFRLARTL